MTDFSPCFDDFRSSAFRLETLQRYDVPAEADRIAAFREHRPLPERSPRTSPFLRRIADDHGRGQAVVARPRRRPAAVGVHPL